MVGGRECVAPALSFILCLCMFSSKLRRLHVPESSLWYSIYHDNYHRFGSKIRIMHSRTLTEDSNVVKQCAYLWFFVLLVSRFFNENSFSCDRYPD